MSRPLQTDKKSALILRYLVEECDVYLCNRPLRNGNCSSRNFMSSLSSPCGSICGDSWNKHWFVILHYGEELVCICEAGNENGRLKGDMLWKDWTSVQESGDLYQRHLGMHRIPKSHAKKVVKEMGDLGKYHVTNNNCQTWAKQLLRQLDVPVPQDMPDAQAVYEEAEPIAVSGIITAVLIGIFGVGLSVIRSHC